MEKSDLLCVFTNNCLFSSLLQSLVIPDKFQHILRIMNTNIDGKRKVGIAMTAIKGVGRRYSNIVLKKADVDLTKRAGECTEEEVIYHINLVFMHNQASAFLYRLTRLSPSFPTLCNTKCPTGSLIDKRISLMANTLN